MNVSNTPLTDDQILHLLQNNPRISKRPGFWERNYAIIILFLTTDIKNSELLSLTLADLDFKNGLIFVREQEKIEYFLPVAQAAVKRYTSSIIRPSHLTKHDLLFGTQAAEDGHTSDYGAWHKGTSQWLTGVVKRHVQAVTGVEGIGTEDLRHTRENALKIIFFGIPR